MILKILLSIGCSNPQQEEAWLLEQLYEDNWRYLERDPQQLKLKFQAMNDSYYAFLRGTLSLYLGRLALYSSSRPQTQFLRSPEATLVPIFGDGHPENTAVCADPSQSATLELVDLDAGDYGPWVLDADALLRGSRFYVMTEGVARHGSPWNGRS